MRCYAEQQLHISIASWLRGVRIVGNKEYPAPIPFPGLIFTHPANQGRTPREGHKLKQMGVRAGAYDFLLWWDAGFGAIELKTPGGSLSPAQNRFGSEMMAIGGRVATCDNADQFRDTLIRWGLECKNMTIPPARIGLEEKK